MKNLGKGNWYVKHYDFRRSIIYICAIIGLIMSYHRKDGMEEEIWRYHRNLGKRMNMMRLIVV